MAQRSLIRPDQLDHNGSYSFAQLLIDGYSNQEDTGDGYLTGIVLSDAYTGNPMLSLAAQDGAISQVGTGQVSFAGNVDAANGIDVTGGNLNVTNDVVISGNLTVNGTQTIINTEQMAVTDPITIINNGGSTLSSTWTGFSAEEGTGADSYAHLGWVFNGVSDGYWALSTNATTSQDTEPANKLAYFSDNVVNGDLSSITSDSGASKVGVNPVGNLSSTNVQSALEELQTNVDGIAGTNSDIFTINQDYDSASSCLKLGTNAVDGYLCFDGTNTFSMKAIDSGDVSTVLSLGSVTSGVATTITFNAEGGASSIVNDGTAASKLVYTAGSHTFAGDATMQNNLTVDGNTILGSDSSDTLTVNALIASNLVPTSTVDAYFLGTSDSTWEDAYFNFYGWTPTKYSPVNPPGNDSLAGHLMGIDAALDAGGAGTNSEVFTINQDRTDVSEACLKIVDDGYDGYLCYSANAGVYQFQMSNYALGGASESMYLKLGGGTSGTSTESMLQFAGFDSGSTQQTFDVVFDPQTLTLTMGSASTTTEIMGLMWAPNDAQVDGNTVIGSGLSNTVEVKAEIHSDLLPLDDAYYLGNETHRWIDGYFSFFTPTHYTPVGSNDSLEGHLRGIDAALSSSLDTPRGVYIATPGEQAAYEIVTTRAVDQGQVVDVGSYTDAQFRDYIYIYWNGQLLLNDVASRAARINIVNDVARKTGSLSTIMFAGDIKKGTVVQIVDYVPAL